MLTKTIVAIVMLCCSALGATAQNFTDDTQLEAFLGSGGITPEAIGMKWHRECRYVSTASGDGSKSATAWVFASQQQQQQMIRTVNSWNQDQTDRVWQTSCRAVLTFPDAASRSSRLNPEPVTYRQGNFEFKLDTGDALRYHACQVVDIPGDGYLQKPGC